METNNANRIVNAHNLLNVNQYYKQITKKTRIVLHHTAGGSAKSSIDWWNEKPDHVSTPYIIDRDGTIYETFDPQYWSYGLGINDTIYEKSCIQIELCNFGGLTQLDGKYYIFGNKAKEIERPKVQIYKAEHRGYQAFEKYTQQQIDSVIYLIDYLSKRFGIKIDNVEKFWYYDLNSNKTLISHTTVRKDKSDIHPQPDLIKAIYEYADCKAPVTE